jgi:sugar lactone lactonase YvrE
MLRALGLVSLLVAACGGQVPQGSPDADPDMKQSSPCTLPALSQTVATLAGCSDYGVSDGTRGGARFHNPTNLAIAATGVAFVTDFDSNRVRAIDRDGNTTTVYSATNFMKPFGIVIGKDGMLYVETDDNDMTEHSINTGTIWRVDPTARTAAVVARNLGRPRGLAVLPDGRIAMADHMHHVVEILNPANGAVTPLAGARDMKGHANGAGTDARFAQPYDLVLAPDGALLVSDYDNHRIRRVQLDGTVTDFAGSGAIGSLNGPADVATFDAPQALAILPNGTLFVSDVKRKLIRRIVNGAVSTVAGDGTPGWLDASEPRGARFYGIEGMDADGARLVIADGNLGDESPFHHIRVIQHAQLP